VSTRKPAPAAKGAPRRKHPSAKPAAKPAVRRPAATAAKPATKAPAARRPAAAKARPRRRTTTKRPGPPRPGPLEASYSATHFRSRAEARWAVFFDLMGWDWDYEPCHYDLGAMNYLPDFYLPQVSTWVEVKGPPFLDAAAMGKAASSVAGPHPLPSRSAPYAQATAMLLLGPLAPAPAPGRPVHQLLVPAAAGLAGMHRAVWEADASMRPIDTKAWVTIPATGAKVARRPTLERAAAILYPDPTGALGMAPALVRAYSLARATRFDEVAGTLARSTAPALLGELANRRRGRPLGCAA
jgi:hypothetical protein